VTPRTLEVLTDLRDRLGDRHRFRRVDRVDRAGTGREAIALPVALDSGWLDRDERVVVQAHDLLEEALERSAVSLQALVLEDQPVIVELKVLPGESPTRHGAHAGGS
jgi:hypothetical protein